jgi:hypothetical protein
MKRGRGGIKCWLWWVLNSPILLQYHTQESRCVPWAPPVPPWAPVFSGSPQHDNYLMVLVWTRILTSTSGHFGLPFQNLVSLNLFSLYRWENRGPEKKLDCSKSQNCVSRDQCHRPGLLAPCWLPSYPTTERALETPRDISLLQLL